MEDGISGPHYNLYKANQAPRNSPEPRKCYGPTNRLTLRTNGRDVESLAINIEIFSRSDVMKVREILDRKLGKPRSTS